MEICLLELEGQLFEYTEFRLISLFKEKDSERQK